MNQSLLENTTGINREQADTLYSKQWDQPFTSLDALLRRISVMASVGGYQLCVYVGSPLRREKVSKALTELGFTVAPYNGGKAGIVEVRWG